ncbi:ESSS subunit of NADH:ubiquinone oxidoreductase-domain-containing protein [Triangularia verruculosa]|uniref:NADH dehydrogenase [ubiquinone] 1 beta subcomplex subunit 11, mitochondrial n=1 Tax=Triangularia verruculosa TaxID=2587418 RepID=A0AAN7AV63_9PEZI|nr:ESSS subunit of NADH:ubiquinone oxidoreductase-domain-containing protein [Triangularia verruculosa]
MTPLLLRSTLAATTRRAVAMPQTVVAGAKRGFSATAATKGGASPQYDPPTGWLWGVKPGEKYVNEGWENLYFYGFLGSFVVFGVAYAWKPDTSIQTWALEEARRRLEAEGILEDPDNKKN